MKFKDVLVNKAQRYSLGVEEESGRYFASFPVRNDFAEYEEYYELTRSQFDLFQQDNEAALAFVTECRNRQKDELLIVQPGRLRGVAN